jgi:transposase
MYGDGNRGYDHNEFRRELEGNNHRAVIPGRRNRKAEIGYDQEPYKKRWLIERIFGKLKENRRLAVRYEKSDINFSALSLSPFSKFSFANSV